MYGRNNPVLRHFGADDLAAQATLQAVDQRRAAGEYVPPSEEVVPRPTPDYDDYFEFDRPVPSGVEPDAHDFLVEEAMGAQRYGATQVPVHYQGASAGPSSASPVPSSPPPGSYDSPNEQAYQGYRSGGQASSRSGGGSPSPRVHDPRSEASRRPYGAYNSQSGGGSAGASPNRSGDSRGGSPTRHSYQQAPSYVQPPFRAGVPATGPVRPLVSTPTGDRRRQRRTTGSTASPPDSRTASPSQPRSSNTDATRGAGASTSGDAVSGSEGHSAAAAVAAAGAIDAATRQARGIGAKISGRPTSARPGSPSASPAARTGATRRPVSASPASAGAGAAGARRSQARAPAWSPAAGIANVRLDEHDEATRVAMMLNDPSTSREVRSAASAAQQQQQAAAAHGTGAVRGSHQQPYASPRAPPSPGAAVSPPRHEASSPGQGQYMTDGQRNRSSEISEQYYNTYRLRKHREAQGVPDHRYSQPRSLGAHAPIQQKYFSFDEAHPAIATEHCLRSPGQNHMLQAERQKMQQAKMRAARMAARDRMLSPTPTTQQLAADVDRLARVREAGRARLRQLEREGQALRQETSQIQQRAVDAIARAEAITVASGLPHSRSPSASPSPPPHYARRSRSPSPAAYYSGGGGGGYGRGGFGPPPRAYYNRSPSRSPGRQRPVSASPYGYYGAEVDEGYYSGGSPGGGAAGHRPVSAPPQPPVSPPPGPQHGGAGHPVVAPAMPTSPPPGPAEAQYILDMINQVERLPQHAQVPVASSTSGAASGSEPSQREADHMARASAIFNSRAPLGVMDDSETRIAMGAYDKARYEEYQRQVDLEMQRRAVDGGYDSDVDRDEAAALLVEQPQEEEDDESLARRMQLEASWKQQNEWMDAYRERFGPEDGYLPERATSEGGGSPLQGELSVMSNAEGGMVGSPYVPIVSKDFPLSAGYASEGPDAYNPHRRTRRKLFFKSTVPKPFEFEERERSRPKSIAKVKFEQDVAIRLAEEAAARNRKFRANPLPSAVVEPRYERMLLEAEVKRQLSHQRRLEELASLMEQPFSFFYRDQERELAREELAKAAKDPNRFQVAFRARDAPTSTKQERFRMMQLELEAKRESTRRRVEEARRAAKERVEEEAKRRQQAANRAYQERLRSVDPAVHYSPNAPHPTKPMGAVPDFNGLHRQWEVQMARARANIRKRITVPQEFRLNGADLSEQAARDRKAEERRQRIILDMQVDAELLPEMRWPYKSPRGKVRPTPMPAYLVERMGRSPGNHAATARKSATKAAAQGGAYTLREEKEAAARKASEKLRAEALRRADRLLKDAAARKQAEAEAAGGGGDFGLASDVGATAAGGVDQSSSGRGAANRRRVEVAGRQDNPQVYVEARHMQIERKVKEVVEDALLDQGIEAYRYVEGVGQGRGKDGSAADAADA
ncbi:hypothetical protein CHLRE_12g492850v5 [Chlamydomonas reinhardtii]|uniref:Uncharacterized protein n=1 Tax=Chlamydomonas reinhardtii TaxID=3055 RepID=A0A2K3D1W2_CHLRE|nr:uncharacterized protein CHLRE_12g492850v5 [Chlamydomonas reinhardtii]PNW74520.1 hypothetical protein CHLRE_12g492850v5 [Chlamydomonas reinhardtii]